MTSLNLVRVLPKIRVLSKMVEYLFYLFIFLLPWQTRWIFKENFLNSGFWEYGSFSLYGTEILLWLILVLFFIWLIKEKRFSWRKFDFKKLKIILPIWGLIFLGGLSAFWATSQEIALYQFFRLLEAAALFVLILNFPFNFKKLSVAFVASAALQGMLAIWQTASQLVWANKWLGMALHRGDILGDFVVETANARWLRAYGSLPHPNILAGFLVIGFILGLVLWFQTKNRWQKSWLLLCSFLITSGLFLTFSRAGWLAGIIAVLLSGYIVYRYQPQNFKKFLLFAVYSLLLIAILAAIFYQPFITRLKSESRLEIKSLAQRADYTRQAKILIKDNWLLGVGIGNYTLAVHNNISPDLAVWDYQPVHNIYLLIWTELGILGLILFLGLILSVGYVLVKSKDPQALAIFFILLILGFFDHYLWSLYFGMILFWLSLGIGIKRVLTRA